MKRTLQHSLQLLLIPLCGCIYLPGGSGPEYTPPPSVLLDVVDAPPQLSDAPDPFFSLRCTRSAQPARFDALEISLHEGLSGQAGIVRAEAMERGEIVPELILINPDQLRLVIHDPNANGLMDVGDEIEVSETVDLLGLSARGKHFEIRLGDPNATPSVGLSGTWSDAPQVGTGP